jgi:hypothetical protein
LWVHTVGVTGKVGRPCDHIRNQFGGGIAVSLVWCVFRVSGRSLLPPKCVTVLHPAIIAWTEYMYPPARFLFAGRRIQFTFRRFGKTVVVIISIVNSTL